MYVCMCMHACKYVCVCVLYAYMFLCKREREEVGEREKRSETGLGHEHVEGQEQENVGKTLGKEQKGETGIWAETRDQIEFNARTEELSIGSNFLVFPAH